MTIENEFRTNKEVRDICIKQIEKIKDCQKTGGHIPLKGSEIDVITYKSYQCAKCSMIYNT
jgi:hypothetical protein